VTRIIREISADQPVERAATLADVRAEVLAPDRLNAFVFSGFAGIALLIAWSASPACWRFSVSARTREFGVRLAIGSAPRQLLRARSVGRRRIAAIGIGAASCCRYAMSGLAASYIDHCGCRTRRVLGAAAVLMAAAVIASLTPAARASRVDVLQALRSE
jgi:hypothetical protein